MLDTHRSSAVERACICFVEALSTLHDHSKPAAIAAGRRSCVLTGAGEMSMFPEAETTRIQSGGQDNTVAVANQVDDQTDW